MNIQSLLCILSGIALAAAQWFIWDYAPIEETMGQIQKIFYFHVSCAWWGLISFLTVFVGGVGYVRTRDTKWDVLAGSAAELGVLLSSIALATGMIWGRAVWGVWWTWDPRLSTTLIMWFIYCAYLVLRVSLDEGDRKRLVLAVIGIVAMLNVPLVFLSARLWRSIHPNVIAAEGGGLEPEMLTTMFVAMAAFGLLWFSLIKLRTQIMGAQARADALAAGAINMEDA